MLLRECASSNHSDSNAYCFTSTPGCAYSTCLPVVPVMILHCTRYPMTTSSCCLCSLDFRVRLTYDHAYDAGRGGLLLIVRQPSAAVVQLLARALLHARVGCFQASILVVPLYGRLSPRQLVTTGILAVNLWCEYHIARCAC